MAKTCFVVGPVGDANSPTRGHADWLLEEIISPVFVEHFKEFEVIRSDKIAQPGMIDAQVINHLLGDELVIADMSLLRCIDNEIIEWLERRERRGKGRGVSRLSHREEETV
jgi:hypothetical protein